MKDFHTLFQKLIDQTISKKELAELEKLASEDPILSEAFEKYSQAIVAIKSHGLMEVNKDS